MYLKRSGTHKTLLSGIVGAISEKQSNNFIIILLKRNLIISGFTNLAGRATPYRGVREKIKRLSYTHPAKRKSPPLTCPYHGGSTELSELKASRVKIRSW